MKELITRSILYGVVFLVVYASEHDIPFGLIWKRFVYLQSWSLASFTQRLAIKSYHHYREEVDTNG